MLFVLLVGFYYIDPKIKAPSLVVFGWVPGIGVRIRGSLEDRDPLSKAPFKRAISRVNWGPLLRGLRTTQYPLVKEHTLNHNIKPPYNLRSYSLINPKP